MHVDGLPFVLGATLLVLLLRFLRGGPGHVVYALLSAVALGLILPGWKARAVALGFVYSPWLLRRLIRRTEGAPFVGWLVIQATLLLWIRGYFAVVPGAADTWLVAHGIAVAGVSYMILRQVEWLLWSDLHTDEPTPLAVYSGFVFGFLTLLAGPILRFAEYRREFPALGPAPPLGPDLLPALHRIVNGYLKVAVFGKLAARLSTPEFVLEQAPSLGVLACAVYLYTVYMYLNFSGYCDVVIGLGRLVGFRLPENFDRPFLAANAQEFWQRWHMTFSSWVRDHVFYPLSMKLRRGPLRRRAGLALVVASLVAFLFVGIWHGPGPSFALFGLLHGVAVLLPGPFGRLVERVGGPPALKTWQTHRLLRVLRVTLCFHFLCLTILLFERDLSVVASMFRHALGGADG